MRFSVAATSLISLVLGSSAVSALDPAYVRTWGIQADPHGRLTRGAPPVVFDGGQIFMANSSNNNNPPYPELRLLVVGVTDSHGTPITAAKLVEYPGYPTSDQGLYMWQPVNGSLSYSTFDSSPGELGSWWFKAGPAIDPQLRLTLNGNSTAKLLWDDVTKRYVIYIGENIPVDHLDEMYDIDLKATEYCGPGYTYCN